MRFILIFFLFFFSSIFSVAQNAVDSTAIDSITVRTNKGLKFNYKQLIIPTVLIGYGVVGLESNQIKLFNSGIRQEVNEHIDEKLSIDDFSQYLPALSVFGLEGLGIKGKNNVKNKAILLTTSYLIMGLTVNSLKTTATVERPDGTSLNSFPSGHTATAFMGAELLYQEYKDVSIWYGISGYLVASGTGAFRMYNNRHWLSDVVAGAGIGILSTKAAYWLLPTINKLFSNNNSSKNNTVFVPFHDGKSTGFGLVSTF